uniref:fibrillin-2-like n=1 Tax=Styela clava TaxID=7725 RepID=UPI00193934B1|nr:fibrillin-2-like [Styela clava]
MAFTNLGLFWIILGVAIVSEAQATYPPTCDSNAVCVGYYSGFNCSCNSGYKGSDGGCVNINECVETPQVCTEIETCNDIIGSYNCTCGDIDIICHDLADASTAPMQLRRFSFCNPDANCSNTVGSYSCACHDGFEGNGFFCIDLNECDIGTHDCVPRSPVTITRGSFDCVCGEDGYCHDNGYCVNLENSTFCVCKIGYIGNGVLCGDVDECEAENDCHSNASCKNTEGSYRCICKEGYGGDGKECNFASVTSISIGLFVLSVTSSMLSYGSS